jgi:hypothetical protein
LYVRSDGVVGRFLVGGGVERRRRRGREIVEMIKVKRRRGEGISHRTLVKSGHDAIIKRNSRQNRRGPVGPVDPFRRVRRGKRDSSLCPGRRRGAIGRPREGPSREPVRASRAPDALTALELSSRTGPWGR